MPKRYYDHRLTIVQKSTRRKNIKKYECQKCHTEISKEQAIKSEFEMGFKLCNLCQITPYQIMGSRAPRRRTTSDPLETFAKNSGLTKKSQCNHCNLEISEGQSKLSIDTIGYELCDKCMLEYIFKNDRQIPIQTKEKKGRAAYLEWKE